MGLQRFFIIFTLVFCFFCLTPGYAAGSTTLSISPATLSTVLNESTTSSIAIDAGADKILTTDLTVSFDPSVLKATDITIGSFLKNAIEIPSTKVIDNKAGRITYSFYTDVANAGAGQGVLATISWQTIDLGTATIAVDKDNTIVYGIGQGNVLSTVSSATYTVVSPPAPTNTPTPQPAQPPSGGGGGGGGSSSSGGGGSSGGSSGGGGSSSTPGGKPGDVNGSGKVDIFDLSILLRNFNKSGQGDLNGDGRVNIFDLSILLRNFGK